MKVGREPLGCAKREWIRKVCSSSFCDNHDEDLKVIGVTPIESLFANIKLDKYATGDESTLARRHPNNLEGEDLNETIDKSGIARSKLEVVMNPLFWISRTLIMIIVL